MSTPSKLRQHIHYATAPDGTRLAWAESGAGPVLVKAANWLTHLEYRVGKPRLEALDAVLLGALPVRAPRRAGLRDERVERPPADRRAVDRRSGNDHRCGATHGAGHAPRHLTGRRGLHHLCDPPPGARRQIDSLWRLCAWSAAARHARQSARLSGDGRSRARLLGERQPDVPAGLHLALHSRRHPGAAAVVQRALPQDDLRRDRGHACWRRAP